jgi:protein arginine N-methyltransferase 1
MRLIVEAQATFLQDQNRLSAYERALRACVKPGDVVLDLGAGSGVLGLLALRAGAAHVYAVDASPALEIARDAVKRLGETSRFTFLQQHSTAVLLPTPVDVVVGDQSGPMGWEGGLFPAFLDASSRLLRPGGTLIPGKITTWAAPVERPDLDARSGMWARPVAGLDYSLLAQYWVSSLPAVAPGGSTSHLGAGAICGEWDLRDRPDPSVPVLTSRSWTIERDARVSGFEVWFVAELAHGVSMTNGPDSHTPISRPRRFLALEHPVEVLAGDRVTGEFLFRPAGPMVAWKGAVERDGTRVAAFAHSNARSLITGRPAT